jgi:hypothetical protein
MDDGKVTDGLRGAFVVVGGGLVAREVAGCLITFINSIFVHLRVLKMILF